jgi:hypothetical protein
VPHKLCEPCETLVASCVPFAGIEPTGMPATIAGRAPADVNLLELVAGIMLIHDALHPGEPLHLREALAAYGVNADHVLIWQVAGKLKRRHGLVLSGEARQAGDRVVDWTWEARRVRSSLRGRRFGGGVVTEWSDVERSEFDHICAKQRVCREEQPKALFHAGDVVDTPGGHAYVVGMALGGYEVKLFSDLPAEHLGDGVSPLSRDGAVYLPTRLIRRQD